MVGLFTGHCHLKGHPFEMELTDDPTCGGCLEKDKSATHILCDCEVIAYLRFRHLGQYFLEPSEYYDAPINEVLHFIRSAGLIRIVGGGVQTGSTRHVGHSLAYCTCPG
jgi:hypothetical protein